MDGRDEFLLPRLLTEPGALSFHGQQQVGEQRRRQFFGSRHGGWGGAKELDGVDVGSEVIEIVEGGVGEHKMEACSGTLEAGAIRLRGDQPPVRIVGVKRADGVRPELHNLLESVIGGGGMSRPRANGVVGRVVVGGVPGLVIQNCES